MNLEDFSALKVPELKAKLESLGLSTLGLKAVLVARLVDHYKADSVSSSKHLPSRADSPDLLSLHEATDSNHSPKLASTESKESLESLVKSPVKSPFQENQVKSPLEKPESSLPSKSPLSPKRDQYPSLKSPAKISHSPSWEIVIAPL